MNLEKENVLIFCKIQKKTDNNGKIYTFVQIQRQKSKEGMKMYYIHLLNLGFVSISGY